MLNPYLELSYPLFEVTQWFCEENVKPESDIENLKQQVLNRFDDFDRACESAGLAYENSQHVKYALTAFIDERALELDAQNQMSTWRDSPLQMQYFGEHMAGEGFFNKLSLLRQSANADVLEIYYLCLQLGFKGIYRINSPDKLMAVQIDVRSQLDGLRRDVDPALSIEIFPDDGLFKKMSKTIPTWIFSAVFVCLIFVFYFGFSFLIDGRLERSKQRVNAYYQSHVHSQFKKIII